MTGPFQPSDDTDPSPRAVPARWDARISRSNVGWHDQESTRAWPGTTGLSHPRGEGVPEIVEYESQPRTL